MLAMQYTIQLPEDYDMSAIEARVEQRKPLFDRVPGLVHKSYLANFDDKLYAPFYIWNDISKLRDFLLDDLFRGVTRTFNRPRVRGWAVVNMLRGHYTDFPTYAIKESDPIPQEASLEELFAREKEKQEAQKNKEGLYLSVLGLDADRWELLRYSLWRDESIAPAVESDCTQTYRVLHV